MSLNFKLGLFRTYSQKISKGIFSLVLFSANQRAPYMSRRNSTNRFGVGYLANTRSKLRNDTYHFFLGNLIFFIENF